MECQWKGNGEATFRKGERKRQTNEEFGRKCRSKEIHCMLFWELQITDFLKSCWSISCKDNDMAADVGKMLKVML